MADQERLKKLEELRKQRDELDRLISELTAPDVAETNIPYTAEFIKAHASRPIVDIGAADPNELLQMKLFINKKCNQISTDYSHTVALVAEILPYKDNSLFKEIFAHKLIEQGRVQVSSHLESYKPLGYVLLCLGSDEIIKLYARLMITRPCNSAEIRGIYAIYFGYLNLKEDFAACWFWLAGVLNCKPNGSTGYVLEAFLSICGDMMHEKHRRPFAGIVQYIKKYFIKEIANDPVETRIKLLLDKYPDR